MLTTRNVMTYSRISFEIQWNFLEGHKSKLRPHFRQYSNTRAFLFLFLFPFLSNPLTEAECQFIYVA